MPLVPACSAVVCLAFEDEQGVAFGARVLDGIRDGGALVPSIWWYELRNALVVNERRGRIEPAQSDAFLQLVTRLRITVEPPPQPSSVMTLARDHRLSVYDAAYVELALRESLPLATLDGKLSQAAARLGVDCLTPD